MVVTKDGNAYLAGFQSNTLRDDINDILSLEGASYSPIITSGHPTVHRWSGVKDLDLETLIGSISDAHGRHLTVSRGLASLIANSLPSFAEVYEYAVPIHVETVDRLAQFDSGKATWRRVERINETGAYKIGLHGTRYAFHDERGLTRQVEYSVAKTLAACAAGHRLHSYDVKTGTFTATIGAEPPWLYARALVASGGGLPRVEDGRVFFDRVEPAVATTILNKMYRKG